MNHPELCLYDVEDGVATLTFNRPDKLNSMIGNMEYAYFERLMQAEADDDVAAIVVTGAGKGWCPGADLAYTAGDGDLPLPNGVIPNSMPMAIRKPTIAAINGACAGAGFGHAMMLDFRIASTTAKFTTAFAQRGLIAEYGLAWLLSQMVGRQVASDLLLTSRVVTGLEMAELGLVNRAVPVEQVRDAAMALAAHLAQNVSPASMATIKHQLLIEPDMGASRAFESSNALMAESLRGEDLREGVMSFLEKRPAKFAPLGSGTTFAWMGLDDDAVDAAMQELTDSTQTNVSGDER